MVIRPLSDHSVWIISCGILLLLTTTTVASLAVHMATNSNNTQRDQKDDSAMNSNNSLSVVFCGNSIQYFNDCPRVVQAMLTAMGYDAQQDSCLRGGTSLKQLWEKGNGMGRKFATPTALLPDGTHYDIGAPTVKALLQAQAEKSRGKDASHNFVLLQDYTQQPAREETRQESIRTLRKHYLPLMKSYQPHVLLLQTFAYRVPGMKNSEDLGDFHAFTEALVDGYEQYAQTIRETHAASSVQVVPMGRAVQHVYNTRRNDLWESMYSWDDFHPSPHATWLQACLICLAITSGMDPPLYNPLWWNECRRMQPPDEKPLPLPTTQEAEDLRQVAMLVYRSEKNKQNPDMVQEEDLNCKNTTVQLSSAL